LNSPEYINRFRNDYEFLEDLYDGILRRGASKAEFDSWPATTTTTVNAIP